MRRWVIAWIGCAVAVSIVWASGSVRAETPTRGRPVLHIEFGAANFHEGAGDPHHQYNQIRRLIPRLVEASHSKAPGHRGIVHLVDLLPTHRAAAVARQKAAEHGWELSTVPWQQDMGKRILPRGQKAITAQLAHPDLQVLKPHILRTLAEQAEVLVVKTHYEPQLRAALAQMGSAFHYKEHGRADNYVKPNGEVEPQAAKYFLISEDPANVLHEPWELIRDNE